MSLNPPRRRMPSAARIASLALTWCLALLPSVVSAEEITNAVGMRLLLLDPGRFEMGERDLSPGFYKDHSSFNTDNDEYPVHPVVLTRPFYLAATEVTVGQFREFVEQTGYVTSAEKGERGAVGWDPRPPADNPRFLSTFRDGDGFDWEQPGFEQGDNHPVVGVSFADANAYCQWLSEKESVVYRLPTEAEWEYAARAGTSTYFSFGDTYRGVIQRFANIGNVELEKAFPDRVRRQWLVDIERDPADRHVFTAPVGSYEANPWGLSDMYGNAWEWCEDRYLDTAYSAYMRAGHQQVRKRAIDPLNQQRWGDEGDWRVIRGGSWFNAPVQCRSGVRGYFEGHDAACYIGFRVARDAPEALAAEAHARFQQSEAARATIERIAERIQERRDGRLTVLLRHENLTGELFAALEQLEEPVDIHLNGEGRLTGGEVAALARAPQLTGLMLSQAGSELTDEDFAVLANHSELELLQISGAPKLTDGLFQYLEAHERLELLQFDASGITDRGLARLPALARLETLNLRGTASQGLVLEHFRHSPLRTLSCDHMTDAGAEHLAHFALLRELTLGRSQITGRGLEVISRLQWLTRLEISDCPTLRDADFAVLGELYDLQSLVLQRTAAGDTAARSINRLNNLRDLQIGSEHLSDAGVRKICEVVSLHSLLLTEEASCLTDAALADLWRLVNLRGLSIAAPKITGSGLASVAELPRLEWLNLGGAGIADVALEHAARSPSLQRLFVGNWQAGGPEALTDAGVLHLAESTSLTQFDLIRSKSQVTETGLEQLRQRRPPLNVSER